MWCECLVDDTTAEAFAAYMKKFPDLYRNLAQIVQNHTSAAQPLIVDLGVGPGLLSVELHRKMPQAVVVGIDPLRKMLLLARENTRNDHFYLFEPLLGVSEHLPLKSNTVDVIVSRFSLPYWKYPEQGFQEMRRVLKQGGHVVLEALNRDFPRWKLWLIKNHMLLNRAGRNVTQYHVDAYKDAHTMELVEHFFTSAGFTILEKKGKKNEWRFIVVAEKI
jgi:ubiquinone/menaquinone biosynthesis C-methylase UbiE